ncbi:hypothetical protein [Streptomyces tubbatahanensis]|uniref:hypothetical protein n=1 Tax=Streptomyces tubbatahanensis TaxID=2923272 RepID=UPI003C6FE7A1
MDTMVRAGQSSEKAALRYQHSNDDRQREVADGIDACVQARRARTDEQGGSAIGHAAGRGHVTAPRQQTRPRTLTWVFVVERATGIEPAL